MLIYGIDPGTTGAIAVMVNGALHDVRDMPTRSEGSARVYRRIDSAGLAAIVREWRAQLGVDSELAMIERVNSMPGQGVASSFSFGHSAGAIEGVLQALGVPVEFVTPAAWKKHYRLSKDKNASRGRASLLFPSHAASWSRVKDDGRAEAVLLARYGWAEA